MESKHSVVLNTDVQNYKKLISWRRGLTAVLFNAAHQCIFPKNNVYFLITVHKDINLEHMQTAVCYDLEHMQAAV